MVAGVSRSSAPLFPLFAANALVASSSASPGSRVLEIFETFIFVFPFLSRKRRESFSSGKTLRDRQSYKRLAPRTGSFSTRATFRKVRNPIANKNGAADERQ